MAISVDCPLCDAPADLREDTGTLECEACAVRLELAADPVRGELPIAA